MKNLVAYGKDIDGDTLEFEIENGWLNCMNNQLTELIIPEGVRDIWCYGNQLTELNIPEGVKRVECEGNQITHLDLPESVNYLDADKEVTGLEKHIGKVEMNLY